MADIERYFNKTLNQEMFLVNAPEMSEDQIARVSQIRKILDGMRIFEARAVLEYCEKTLDLHFVQSEAWEA